MQTISVPLQKKSYPIWIKNSLINNIHELLDSLNQGQRWVVFSQKVIFDLYGIELVNNLSSHKFKVDSIILNGNEDAKSIDEVRKIYSQLISFGCDRNTTFIALGGGVVGDVTGFIAATYMRGVDYIQIPTSLLAMVDSSIGGKTGVNLKEGKNLVGSIWQPKAVIIDPKLLKTLSTREIASAFGEIIKYGAIFDRVFLDLINHNIEDLINLNNDDLLEQIIGRCVKLKADIIARDEFELGQRKILNFGHTIGHALEIYFGFENLRHGEAISYGMLAAGKLSVKYSRLDNEKYHLLHNVIKKLPLPKLSNFKSDEILKIMQRDKKVKLDKFNFVLLKDIGDPVIYNNISNNSILNILETL